jgi:hypothetical protein
MPVLSAANASFCGASFAAGTELAEAGAGSSQLAMRSDSVFTCFSVSATRCLFTRGASCISTFIDTFSTSRFLITGGKDATAENRVDAVRSGVCSGTTSFPCSSFAPILELLGSGVGKPTRF